MAKTSRNKKTRSENILELLYKLEEKGWLEKFEDDLNKRKGSEGFKKIFRIFKGFVKDEVPVERVPSDQALGKQLGQEKIQFDTSRRDFYNRIIEFAGRVINKQEPWYEEALKILTEVDALWTLGLRDHAEMRFIEIYKVYPKEENLHLKYEYNYGLSKIFYYCNNFFVQRSLLGMEEVHKEFIQKDRFQLIRELEIVANRLEIRKPMYGEPEKWRTDSAVFRYLNVLAMLAKQKKEFSSAREILKEQMDVYAGLASNYHIRGEGGKRSFNFFADNEPQNASEIETAFYYYLKLEEFHLCILDGDPFQAENILQELYRKLNETFEKSRNNLAAVILFLRLELEQSMYALSLSGKDLEQKMIGFETSFLATKKEVNSLPVRLEINRMIFDFMTTPEVPDYEKLKAEIKEIDGKIKGAPDIRLDLCVLKLLGCFDGQRYEDIKENVRSVKAATTESKRESKLINQFLLKISKVNQSDLFGLRKEFTTLLAEIEPLKNCKNHLDNLIVFWLRQYGSRGHV